MRGLADLGGILLKESGLCERGHHDKRLAVVALYTYPYLLLTRYFTCNSHGFHLIAVFLLLQVAVTSIIGQQPKRDHPDAIGHE